MSTPSMVEWVIQTSQHADSPLPAWQRCNRCGRKVDLPDDVLKAADARYCSDECLPPPQYGKIDVFRLRPPSSR